MVNRRIIIIFSRSTFKYSKPSEFKVFLDCYDTHKKGVYQEAGYAVKALVDNYGEDRLLKFLTKIKDNNDLKVVKKAFKEVYDVNLSYSFFNRLL